MIVARQSSEKMVRSPCCEDRNLKKGPWTQEEDRKLVEYIKNNGYGSWSALPKLAGLNRCGKSCRLRWTNYLRPDIKRGKFSDEEEEMIIKLHSVLGNKWSRIATHLPGRTDNEIKNFWNTHVKKKFLKMGLDPNTHQPRTDYNSLLNLSQILSTENLSKIRLLQNIFQIINTGSVLSQNVKGASSLLLGSHNLTPFEGFVNGNPILDPIGFPNPELIIPDSHNNYKANSSTWACINEGGSRSEVLNFNNNCSSSSYDIPIEQPLPALASFSPDCSIYQMERKMNPAFASAASSPSDIFEAWGELMDDETGGSYWKDVLE